jgi:hypothetical protein
MTGIFRELTMDGIAVLVNSARSRVTVASPGIDGAVASALAMAAGRLCPGQVQVILDVAEENCRVGYGNEVGYATLVEAKVAIRRCTGLRIGFVVTDDEGYIFGLPPLMVEPVGMVSLNAVRATPSQIDALVSAAAAPTASDKQAFLPLTPAPEIGIETVPPEEIRRIEKSLTENPVQDFDLGRVVRVFNAHIQFVELSVEGTQLQHHTVKLPPELLTAVKDQKTRDRLTAAFKMVADGSRIAGDGVRQKANEIRRTFIKSHPIYGGICLKSKRAALEAEVEALKIEIEKYKGEVRKKFSKEVERSKAELVMAFWRAIRNAPPQQLMFQIEGDKPTTEEAKAYLALLLDEAFPDVEQVCEGMTVSFVSKDVTWQTLNDQAFVDWLRKQFPLNKNLNRPFEEYKAARQRLDAMAKVKGVVSGGRR